MRQQRYRRLQGEGRLQRYRDLVHYGDRVRDYNFIPSQYCAEKEVGNVYNFNREYSVTDK